MSKINCPIIRRGVKLEIELVKKKPRLFPSLTTSCTPSGIWWADPITNLTLLEDEFTYKVVSNAGKKAPLPEKEALLILEKKSSAHQPRTPSVKETLQKALKWQALLDSGEVASRSEIARREGISPAHVTQVMYHLRLPPQIQEYILSMPLTARRPVVSIRSLRPITHLKDQKKQVEAFKKLVGQRE